MALYPISGAPCSGKTSVVEELRKRGYDIVPEAAEIIIKRETARGSDCLPNKNNIKFQNTVFDMALELEDACKGNGTVFCDRSLIDGYAYVLFYDKMPLPIYEKIARDRYEKVFVLDMIPDYRQTDVRKETEKEAREVDRLIRYAYRKFGYDPVEIPVFDGKKDEAIGKRADMILDCIRA